MTGYVLRRLGVAVVLLWIVSMITFAVYLKVPADPAGFLVDMQHATPAAIARAHHELGTDRPVLVHFTDGSTAEGDFVIGADGVHSAARRHVIPDGPKPFDTGLIGFGGFIPRSVIEHTGIGQRVQTTFGQSGFFGYGFCSPDPDDGASPRELLDRGRRATSGSASSVPSRH